MLNYPVGKAMSISQRIRKQMEQPNGLTQEKIEPLAAEFAARVRARREALGVSQEELAHTADLHRTYISRVERADTMVSLLTIVRLARALDVDPGEMIAGLTTSPTTD